MLIQILSTKIFKTRAHRLVVWLLVDIQEIGICVHLPIINHQIIFAVMSNYLVFLFQLVSPDSSFRLIHIGRWSTIFSS